MVHVVVIAHSELASSVQHCIEHIFSKKIDYLHVIGIRSTDNIGTVEDKIQKLVSDLVSGLDDKGNFGEVLILTDLFGATPHNIASKLVVKHKIELITGLNLPMVIRAVSYANESFEICVNKTLEGAVSGIIHVNGNKESTENGTY